MNSTRSLASSCRHVCAILMALAMLTHTILLAETTGKLTGRVVDQRGQAVLGANVVVVGTTVGGVANDEGQYNIINVPAGVYDVRTSAVGYQAKIVRGVHINAGQTTTLDFAISESTIEADEVVTIAERPLVDTRQTSAVAILSKDDIEALPVQNLNDVVNLQAGVVDGHFRGGRAGEVQYQVDGVSVNNPYDNSSVIQLDRSVLQEVQVISGTFDAEYGQAMSGVVNAILRSGSEEQFEASAEIYGGAYVTGKDVFPHTAVSWPPALQSLTMSLSGPAGIPHTSFLMNIRRFTDDGYLWGQQTFLPTDASDFGARRFTPAGSNAAVPMAWHKEWSGQFKIANRALTDVQLSYQAVGVLSEGKGFEFGYRFNPDGTRTQKNWSLVHGVDFTHTLSANAFYTLSVRQNYFHYTDEVFSSLNDPGYALAGAPRGDPNYELGAIIQGYDLGRFEQKTNALLLKGSLTSQVTRLHLVKLGFEVQTSSILFGAPGTLASQILGPTQSLVYEVADTLAQNVRTYYPRSMAIFIQDRIEVADFLVRAGLRAEYYDANATVPSDLENPANTIQGAPSSVQKPTTKKFAFAPRLGVSYPITATGALYFSYGHFYQMPGLGNLYANSDYYILRNLQSGNTSYGVMGNPDIKPEFTTQYEFGFKQQFGQSLGVDLSVFYKDIRDLLGVEFIDTYADSRYARFTNVDFGSVYGIRLAVDQRFTEAFSVSLNYTYQNAMGNASDPHETANRAAAGEDPRPRQVPFDWDQRHTMNIATTVNDHDNLLATCIVRFGSGSPYTPSVGSGFGAQLEKNSSPKPTWVTVDLRAQTPFHIGTFTLNAFLRVFNLFDARYANGFVFSTTGSAFYSLTSAADRETLIDPSRYTAPRRIEFGLGMRI
jgi:outer membrane receptor protein involved in Fe transport